MYKRQNLHIFRLEDIHNGLIQTAFFDGYNTDAVFGTEIMSRIPELIHSGSSFHYEDYDISRRELEIIRLIADGLSNKEIASQLFLSEGTVRNYLSSILDKLQLRDRTQVAVFYYKHK